MAQSRFAHCAWSAALLLTAASGLAPAQAQIATSDVPLALVPSVPARIEAMPRELPRAKGPGLRESIDLAQAAFDACAAKGGKISVLVTDSVGAPVVLLSGDGAGERSQLITSTKAATVVKYRMPSAEVGKKAKADPKLAAEIRANPNIGAVRSGGFPLMKGEELIGALAVSGFTGVEEECAKAAMAKVPLK